MIKSSPWLLWHVLNYVNRLAAIQITGTRDTDSSCSTEQKRPEVEESGAGEGRDTLNRPCG